MENEYIQIGIKSYLLYDYMSSKNRLRIELFIGNKYKDRILENYELKFFGNRGSKIIFFFQKFIEKLKLQKKKIIFLLYFKK
jgi:hypothetical protein